MLKEVPPNCTVVGVPGRIVKRNDVKVPRSDMNQVDLPDPVMENLVELHKENEMLRAQLQELSKKKKDKEKEKREKKESKENKGNKGNKEGKENKEKKEREDENL